MGAVLVVAEYRFQAEIWGLRRSTDFSRNPDLSFPVSRYFWSLLDHYSFCHIFLPSSLPAAW